MDCEFARQGRCAKVPYHSVPYRVFAAVLGTAPGLLVLLMSSQFGQAFERVKSMIPEMFYGVCAIVSIIYVGVIWYSTNKADRAKIEEYATQTAATFSTTIAALPFLAGVLAK
jgi:hypothetical protein